jgi:hypothetical protein
MVQQKNADKDDSSFSFFAFGSPFSLGLWLMFFLAILVTGSALHIIEFLNSDQSSMERSFHQGFAETVVQGAFAVTGTGSSSYETKSGPGRLVHLSMNFLCLVFIGSYTANLASFMVTNNNSSKEINDLQAAVRNSKMICYWGGTPQEQYFKTRYPEYPNQYGFSANDGISNNEFTLFELIQQGKCEIGLTGITTFNSAKRDFTLNKFCNLEWVGRIIDIGFASFPIAASAKYWLVKMV